MQTGKADSKDVLRERLRAIAVEIPELAWTARLYGAVLPILCDEELPILHDDASEDEVRARLEQGIPFLEGRDLDVDAEKVTSLLVRLAAAAEVAGARVSAEQIRSWISEDQGGDACRAVEAILANDKGRLGRDLERRDTDRDLFEFLAQLALKPVLRSWARRLFALVAEPTWDREQCYVCGSVAVFAELQGKHQEKHLRCGLCGADWRVARLSCPHCGNSDHRSLKVFLRKDDPLKPGIEACDRCMTYRKVISAFSPTPVDLVPVEDLATLPLDAVAMKKGYQRGAALP